MKTVHQPQKVINVKKGQIFLLPTRVLPKSQYNDIEDLSVCSSDDSIINVELDEPTKISKHVSAEITQRKLFEMQLEKFCDQLGYDIDGYLLPDDAIYTSFSEAAHFSPFVVCGESVEAESIALWDYYGGTTCFDLNVVAGDTVNAVAEEYQVRAVDESKFLRMPFQWTLARWITGRYCDPYVGLIPSHFIVSKKFYNEHLLLYKYPVWYQGNNEIEDVLRSLISDRSALCAGLFAIFSPVWLNPDPRDPRCFFLMLLTEKPKNERDVLKEVSRQQFRENEHFSSLIDDQFANYWETSNNKKVIDDQSQLMNDFRTLPYNPALITITRSAFGHYELMSKRYDTLYDLVFHLSTHRSSLPHKLVYDRLSPDVVRPHVVPPPCRKFTRDVHCQPMHIEQWAAMHYDEVTSRIEQEDKFFFVSKSLYDHEKKLHEKIFRGLGGRKNHSNNSFKEMKNYMSAFKRPKLETKKNKKGEEKKKDKNNTSKKNLAHDWSELPPHESVINTNSHFLIDMDRVKKANVTLGSGAFGSVEKCYYQLDNNDWVPVAVKKLRLTPITKEERNPAFGELEILTMLCHPNVSLFYGFSFDKETNCIYFVFELMETSLDKYIEKIDAILSENERLNILGQVCRGMAYLHSRTPAVIHADLAARNVLLKKHPVQRQRMLAKLTDFGLSKLCRPECFTTYNEPNKIPFKWLPPEVLSSRTVTLKTDVWSFGMICYETYGIGEPYGILAPSKVYQYLKDGYRFDRLPGMSPCILSIALECWRVQPVDRPHFSELAERFESYIIEYDDEDEKIIIERLKTMYAKKVIVKRAAEVRKIIDIIQEEKQEDKADTTKTNDETKTKDSEKPK